MYTPTATRIEAVAPAARVLKNGILIFDIENSHEWRGDTALLIESYNGDYKTGSVLMQAANSFGFQSNNPDPHQVAIQLYNLAPTSDTLTKLIFRLINSWNNNCTVKIDRVRLQYDEEQDDPVSWETTANKVSTWSAEPDDTHYPTEKLVKESVDVKLDITQMLGEFDTEEKKYQARENLGLNVIDGGTF